MKCWKFSNHIFSFLSLKNIFHTNIIALGRGFPTIPGLLNFSK